MERKQSQKGSRALADEVESVVQFESSVNGIPFCLDHVQGREYMYLQCCLLQRVQTNRMKGGRRMLCRPGYGSK